MKMRMTATVLVLLAVIAGCTSLAQINENGQSVGDSALTSTDTTTFPAGWNMFSFPLTPEPSDWPQQLGDDISPLYVYRYNPLDGGYQMWASGMSTFAPVEGQGYWTKAAASTEVDVQGTVITGSTFTVHLGKGWNMIGQPFQGNVNWGAVMVFDPETGQIKILSDAHNNSWLSQFIYGYNPAAGAYVMQYASNGVLAEWQGYWVKAFKKVTLLIPAPATLAGDSPQAIDSALWSAQLLVSIGAAKDDENYAVVSTNASVQYDVNDAPEPPPIPDEENVRLYFPHQDWPVNPGNFTQDARPESANGTWGFEVVSSFSGNVTLTWDVSQVPSSYLTVELRDSNNVRLVPDMRTTSQYLYSANESVPASFKLVVDERQDVEESTTLAAGWNLFSFPLYPDPGAFNSPLQLGDDITQTELNSIYRYNTATGSYEYWQTLQYPAEIGRGYWMSLSSAKTVDSWGFLTASANHTIPLLSGWNYIGHPFDFTVAWGDAMVYNPATQETVSIATASSRGWVSQWIYWYDPSIGGYRMAGASNGQLWPWYGYLVRSFITADLIIPANPMEGLRAGGDSYPTLDEAAATGKDAPIPPPPPPSAAKTPE